MNRQPSWFRRSMVLALIIGLLILPEAIAGGKRGGAHRGGVKAPPRMSAAHRSNNASAHKTAPRASYAKAPARSSNMNATRSSNANVARSGNKNVAGTGNGQARVATAQHGGNTGVVAGGSSTGFSPSTYRYGSGSNSRGYQAHGYGRGYRNHYSSGRSGYGQSQGNSRAVVSRLKSVHQSLARLDHDYRGHRVQAMHHLSMAVRQLSHRSMGSSTSRQTNGVNGNVNGIGNNNNNVNNNQRVAGNGANRNAGANGRANQQHLSQAQSDQRLSQAMRTTQGVAMQMSHQGTNSSGSSRARGHVQQAMREMHTALTVR